MANATLESTLFPVREIPAVGKRLDKIDNNELYPAIINNSGYKFIVREDTGEILSCMTDDYRLVSNTQLIDTALPVLEKEGAELREVSVFSEGRRTLWRFTFPNVKVKVDKGDLLNPEVVIINSYDGTAEIKATGGAYRMICSNGLIIGTIISMTKNKHSIWNKNIDSIEESILNTIKSTKSVMVESFPKLIETKIKRKKDIESVIKMLPSYTMETLTQYLISHNPKTYWDLLNALTYISTHHMKRDRGATLKLENEIYPSIIRMAKA